MDCTTSHESSWDLLKDRISEDDMVNIAVLLSDETLEDATLVLEDLSHHAIWNRDSFDWEGLEYFRDVLVKAWTNA